MAIDTQNRLAVGMQGDNIVILGLRATIPREDALNMAAWIVALADEGEFEPLLEAVQET